ncbi:MAG: hypothetical protein ACLPYO_00035 [Mycobacterium sp.]
MVRDQTIAEVPASGGAYRDYLYFTRPAVARQMRTFGLEFECCAAERDGRRLAQLAVDDFGRHHRCTFAGDNPSAEIAFAAMDRLHGTDMDDPVRQIEPALTSAAEPWPPATR